MKKTLAFLSFIALAALFTGGGCVIPERTDDCQHQCECNADCSKSVIAACEKDADETRSDAASMGCASAYDEMTACIATATCATLHDRTACKSERDNFAMCADSDEGG